MRIILLILFTITLMATLVEAQTPVPRGPEFQVNTNNRATQVDPAISPYGEGNFVVVWGQSAPLLPSEVLGQRFASSGVPLSGEFRLQSSTTFSSFSPSVSSYGAGEFVVVWGSYESNGDDSWGASVQGQRFASDGEPLAEKFQVNTITTFRQVSPAVSSDGAGGFVVVWKSFILDADAGFSEIKGQQFTADGSFNGSEFRVNSYTTERQNHPAVSPNGAGEFVASWDSSGSSGSDNSGYSIQSQRFNSEGLLAGNQFQVNTYTTTGQNGPAISPDGGEGFVVVWTSAGTSAVTASYDTVHGQRFRSNGDPSGEEFEILSHTHELRNHQKPSVSPDGAGGFVVVWDYWEEYDTRGKHIRGQRFHSNGALAGSEFQVNTYTTGSQEFSTVSSDGAGGFIVAWANEVPDCADDCATNIQAQRFFTPGSGGEPFTCVEDSWTLCLQGGRYEVRIYWQDFHNNYGQGQVVPGASSDSGLFHFFNPDNWEMLVKVLDGCSLNSRYWVFAAATTDVEYTLTVRDSFTGDSVAYHNDLGIASPAITDTNAFSTCP